MCSRGVLHRGSLVCVCAHSNSAVITPPKAPLNLFAILSTTCALFTHSAQAVGAPLALFAVIDNFAVLGGCRNCRRASKSCECAHVDLSLTLGCADDLERT